MPETSVERNQIYQQYIPSNYQFCKYLLKLLIFTISYIDLSLTPSL